MNKQLVTLLVLLDLSASFDTVDPRILLTRLRSKLGLNGIALLWLCSYLTGRTQWISVQGTLSNVFHLRYGVPLGTCQGPVLFNIYSSKICDIDGRHLPLVHCYADDSQLYLSLNPSCAVSRDEAIRSMETCISDVKQWMMGDKLMLNDDKTKFIVIASRHLLKKIAINKSGWLKCLYCGIWACGLMINLLWPYTLPKYAVSLSITYTILDALGNIFQWIQLRLLSTPL